MPGIFIPWHLLDPVDSWLAPIVDPDEMFQSRCPCCGPYLGKGNYLSIYLFIYIYTWINGIIGTKHVIPWYIGGAVPIQLVVIEPLPIDLFTTYNKLRHLRKMVNEEQDEATSLYISFVMSMVMAQTPCTTALFVAMIMVESCRRRSSPSTSRSRKRSRACTERKVQFPVQFTVYKCDYQPSYLWVLMWVRWSQTKVYTWT